MQMAAECIASLLLDFASLGRSPVAVPPIVSKSAWLSVH